jgi:cytochrome c553
MPKADPAARKNALDSLCKRAIRTCRRFCRSFWPIPPCVRGVRGLAAYDDPKSAEVLLNLYNSLNQAEKKDALNTLVSRATYAKALLGAVANKSVPARDLSADIVRQLRNFKDAEINQQVEKLWGVARDTEADKLKEIARYKSMITVEPAGEASRGRAVFARTCFQCHTLFGEGGKVGPTLPARIGAISITSCKTSSIRTPSFPMTIDLKSRNEG